MNKLSLGQLVATCGIANKMEENREFLNFVKASLEKYCNKDWGDTCAEDKKSNDYAVENGERIMAVYIHPETKEKIWIITEWDRSATTILFPSPPPIQSQPFYGREY